MIKAILFDMDGVIVDSMKFHALSWKKVFLEKGVELEDNDIYCREGMSGPASIMGIYAEKGLPVPPPVIINEMISRKHMYFEDYKVSLYPCVQEILEFLKQKGKKTGLVTGSGRRAVIHAIPEKVLLLFDATVSSDDVTRGKPDPEPYLQGLGKLSVSAEETLVIENAPLGLESAVGAGIQCIAVETTLPASYLTRAKKIFRDHAELFHYLKKQEEAGWTGM